MGMSRQTAFTLMLLLAFSAIVPGSAGYLSVKLEAIGQAQRELRALESRLRHERLATRLRKMERHHRDRWLQPVVPREPVRGTPSGPAALAPMPVPPRERPPSRARRQDSHGPGTAGQDAQRLIAQWRAADEMTGEVLGREQWPSLERRGGRPQYRECDADDREKSGFTAQDVIEPEPSDGFLPELSQAETPAN